MFYLETGSHDPCYNLAFEEYVLGHRTEGEWLILWQNASTVVIGLNQTAEEEINREYVEAHGVAVVRRKTGGGAVYHDLGNLNYSFISDSGPYETLSLRRFTEPICRALGTMGLEAECSGRNDITVGGRKVSGVAQRVQGGRILHHGTLLFDSDPDAIAGALNADPEKFSSKSTKSVRARVGNIRGMLKEDRTLEEFKELLLRELAAGELTRRELAEEELEAVRTLAEKYRSWDWTYARSPGYAYTNKKRFPGGTLGVSADIKNGVLEDVRFSGDFMARRELSEAEAALRGRRFQRPELMEALSGLDIESMFGAISAEEILEVLL